MKPDNTNANIIALVNCLVEASQLARTLEKSSSWTVARFAQRIHETVQPLAEKSRTFRNRLVENKTLDMSLYDAYGIILTPNKHNTPIDRATRSQIKDLAESYCEAWDKADTEVEQMKIVDFHLDKLTELASQVSGYRCHKHEIDTKCQDLFSKYILNS